MKFGVLYADYNRNNYLFVVANLYLTTILLALIDVFVVPSPGQTDYKSIATLLCLVVYTLLIIMRRPFDATVDMVIELAMMCQGIVGVAVRHTRAHVHARTHARTAHSA